MNIVLLYVVLLTVSFLSLVLVDWLRLWGYLIKGIKPAHTPRKYKRM